MRKEKVEREKTVRLRTKFQEMGRKYAIKKRREFIESVKNGA